MLGDSEAGGSSVSSFSQSIHLERIVIVGCVGSELHFGFFRARRYDQGTHFGFFVFGGVEEVLAAFSGECNTICFECIHPDNGVFEKVIDGWFDKLEWCAGSDGDAHIRVREEQFQKIDVPRSDIG